MSSTPSLSTVAPRSAGLWHSASFLLVVATLCWAGNFVVGRAVNGVIPPIALAFWRWLLAFLIVLPFALPHLRRERSALVAKWPEMILLSALGVAAFNSLVYVGLRTTTVINGVLMQSVMPLLILFCSYLFFRDRVKPAQLAAVAVSLLGVGMIVARGSVEVLRSLSLNPGDGLVFLAVVGYAIYSVRLRNRPAVHPLSFVATTIGIGATLLLPFMLAESRSTQWAPMGPATFGALAYVSVFPSLIAYVSFNRAVELIGANRAGQYVHLMPVFGSLLAAIFLHERLEPYHGWGILLIAAGILMANLAAMPARSTRGVRAAE